MDVNDFITGSEIIDLDGVSLLEEKVEKEQVESNFINKLAKMINKSINAKSDVSQAKKFSNESP